jgi:hypothetical protein
VTNLDLDRAARAGGFTDDLAYGRRVVEILMVTVGVALKAAPSASAETIIDAAVAGVADELHPNDPGAGENPMWLSAVHNAIADAYQDVLAQVAEDRARRAGGLSPARDGAPMSPKFVVRDYRRHDGGGHGVLHAGHCEQLRRSAAAAAHQLGEGWSASDYDYDQDDGDADAAAAAHRARWTVDVEVCSCRCVEAQRAALAKMPTMADLATELGVSDQRVAEAFEAVVVEMDGIPVSSGHVRHGSPVLFPDVADHVRRIVGQAVNR